MFVCWCSVILWLHCHSLCYFSASLVSFIPRKIVSCAYLSRTFADVLVTLEFLLLWYLLKIITSNSVISSSRKVLEFGFGIDWGPCR